MMNYIVLDLEWDSVYCVKEKRFLNQIIQIGAVKLNSDFDIIDTFEQTVRSSISKKLTRRFVNLTGITADDMLNGVSLKNAFLNYNKWVGDDTVTLTWSTSDLYTIIENTKYILYDEIKFKIDKYVDLQAYVQNAMRKKDIEINSQISLSNAADLVNISQNGLDLHTAKDDSILAVSLLKYAVNIEPMKEYICDTNNPEFYRRLYFRPYFISNIKDERILKSDLEFKCDKCGKQATIKNKWKYKNGWFSAKFNCKNCGRTYLGRVQFKQMFDKVKIRKRIIEIKVGEKLNANSVQLVSEKMQCNSD